MRLIGDFDDKPKSIFTHLAVVTVLALGHLMDRVHWVVLHINKHLEGTGKMGVPFPEYMLRAMEVD
jgi:hypothetical protein